MYTQLDIYVFIMQSVRMTIKEVSSIPTNGEVNLIQLYDNVCHWLAAGRWFSAGSSNNKTNRHDIIEILLKVALNTIILTENPEVHNYI